MNNTTPPDAPRCPMCGGEMHDPLVISADIDPHEWYYCDACNRSLVVPHARVPCPACGGKRLVRVNNPTPTVQLYIQLSCLVCRGSGTVPPGLAAAWTADGERKREVE